MKKIAFILAILLISANAFSQSLQFFLGEDEVTDTIEFSPRFMNDDNNLPVLVKNVSGETLNLYITKTVVAEAAGSYNTFCVGDCYDPSTMTSTVPMTLEPGAITTEDIFHIVYIPCGAEGTTIVTYNLFDPSINTQSLGSFTVKFITEEVGIANNAFSINTFNAYPNPATSQVTIQYDLANSASTSNRIVITNLVGNKVCTFPITSASGRRTIDLTNLVAGIYFYSLESNGRTISTKKLIVK